MAELFGEVFNKSSIYDMLFFNVKSVLNHQTLDDLEGNDVLFEHWKYLARTKYYDESINQQKTYGKYAPYYPEFTKIVAITYATLYVENGTLKRYLKKIVNSDEFVVLSTFMDELFRISKDGIESSPNHFPILCGHNIKNHDIPLLIKKFIFYRNSFETKQIPYILKRSLDTKPWESSVIDTLNVWKFNGIDNTSLMMISDFMGLKKTVDLLPADELSREYWDICNEKPEDALELVSLQSATQTNLVIQLMNELRQL